MIDLFDIIVKYRMNYFEGSILDSSNKALIALRGPLIDKHINFINNAVFYAEKLIGYIEKDDHFFGTHRTLVQIRENIVGNISIINMSKSICNDLHVKDEILYEVVSNLVSFMFCTDKEQCTYYLMSCIGWLVTWKEEYSIL